MKRCESCGAENSAQATFCAKCGKKLQNKEYSGRAAEDVYKRQQKSERIKSG